MIKNFLLKKKSHSTIVSRGFKLPEISANVPKSLRLIISINDNGGFNRHHHVGEEEE